MKKFFSLLLVAAAFMMLCTGAYGLYRGNKYYSEACEYLELLDTRISAYEELAPVLEEGRAEYDAACAEYTPLLASHTEKSASHLSDLALYTATRGGITAGDEQMSSAWAQLASGKLEMENAYLELEAGLEEFNAGKAELEEGWLTYSSMAEALADGNETLSAGLATCTAGYSTIDELRRLNDDRRDDPTNSVLVIILNQNADLSEYDLNLRLIDALVNLIDSADPDTVSQLASYGIPLDKDELLARKSRLETAGPDNYSPDDIIITKEQYDQLVELLSDPDKADAALDDAEAELDNTMLTLQQTQSELQEYSSQMETLRQTLVAGDAALAALEPTLLSGKAALDAAMAAVEAGEVQLSVAQYTINQTKADLTAQAETLRTEKEELSAEQTELDNLKSAIDSYDELLSEQKTNKYRLLKYQEIQDAVDAGGELLPCAKAYRASYSAQAEKEYLLRKIILAASAEAFLLAILTLASRSKHPSLSRAFSATVFLLALASLYCKYTLSAAVMYSAAITAVISPILLFYPEKE